MRTKYAIKNISISIFSQLVIIFLGFLSRKIFLDNLGTEYLGINGFLSNILSAMVLIEGGIGISIVYNLYKPLAEKDTYKIIALIQLYKKAYAFLAVITFSICIIVYPFIYRIINSNDNCIYGFSFVYWIFVAKNSISYLFAYKWALINADQKGYILAKNNLIFQIISMSFKIIILIITKNYITYLLGEIILFLIQNIVNFNIVNKKYPYIKTKDKYKIDKKIRANINNNIKAMFIQNIGSYAIFSTDNLLISLFINIKTVGFYSNYTMILGQLSSLIGTIIGGISNSIGNLIATEDKNKTYLIFNITYLISFWIYSISVIFLFNLIEPFIGWWLGEGYLLNKLTLIILLVNFYLNGMRKPIGIFKSKSGLFAQDKYATVIEGAINLLASIIFVKYLGLAGIFLGTTISYLCISWWNQPFIVYKYKFEVCVKKYFLRYFLYVGLTLITGILTTFICNNFILGNDFSALILRGVICLIITNLINIAIFYKTDEFQYIWKNLKTVIRRKYTIKNTCDV